MPFGARSIEAATRQKMKAARVVCWGITSLLILGFFEWFFHSLSMSGQPWEAQHYRNASEDYVAPISFSDGQRKLFNTYAIPFGACFFIGTLAGAYPIVEFRFLTLAAAGVIMNISVLVSVVFSWFATTLLVPLFLAGLALGLVEFLHFRRKSGLVVIGLFVVVGITWHWYSIDSFDLYGD